MRLLLFFITATASCHGNDFELVSYPPCSLVPSQNYVIKHVKTGELLYVDGNNPRGEHYVLSRFPSYADGNLFQVQQASNRSVRIYHPESRKFLFISDERMNGDFVLKAMDNCSRDSQTVFSLQDDPNASNTFTIFNETLKMHLFVSNDRRAHHRVVEAHSFPYETRNLFQFLSLESANQYVQSYLEDQERKVKVVRALAQGVSDAIAASLEPPSSTFSAQATPVPEEQAERTRKQQEQAERTQKEQEIKRQKDATQKNPAIDLMNSKTPKPAVSSVVVQQTEDKRTWQDIETGLKFKYPTQGLTIRIFVGSLEDFGKHIEEDTKTAISNIDKHYTGMSSYGGGR
jgi:FKBP-type peptidyl-prolyl cis-trans isomerase